MTYVAYTRHKSIRRSPGRTMTLGAALAAGEDARIQIGDTFWRVHAAEALTAGARVRVVGTAPGDSMKLEIREA